jgi:D-glycero-D-manno-heptose 1,7-bisphosphate phosphatase
VTTAVFLDRDGVINGMVLRGAEIDSPQHPGEFRLLPGASAGIRKLNSLGLPVVVVSNQPGIAKGKSTHRHLEQMTKLMLSCLRIDGASLDGVYYCLHHPHAVLDTYRMQCRCRKPGPGLLESAASDLGLDLRGSYMVGDRNVDIVAGHACGCTTLLVGDGTDTAARPDVACSDLEAAARWIAAREGAPYSRHLGEIA